MKVHVFDTYVTIKDREGHPDMDDTLLEKLDEMLTTYGVPHAFTLVLNSTYGAMKDKHNAMYDPRQANNVCVGGQLLLLDLIERLEDHCEIIQSNTDGILVKLRRYEDFEMLDDLCWEWEQRTGMRLEFDEFQKVYQKDVNNYIIIPSGPLRDEKGKPRWKCKGA